MSEIIEEMRRRKIATIRIEYSGSGDEGYFNDLVAISADGMEAAVPNDLGQWLENWGYDVLSQYCGGWEINEGSDGTITLDATSGTATLDHNENFIKQRNEQHVFAVEA